MGWSNHFWLAKCWEAARTMEDNEAEGAFSLGGLWNFKGPVNQCCSARWFYGFP